MERTALLLAAMVSALVLASVVALVVPKKHAQAAFPGQEGKIAFVSNRAGGLDIYTMNPSGKKAKRITSVPRPDLMPSWSPDGTKIAYSHISSNFLCFASIHTINADGSNGKEVTSGDCDVNPAFSPSGRKIVFERDS
jgi:Tol biopolymer transport system component